MTQTSPETNPRSFAARLFAPRLNRWFLPRLILVALGAYLFFGHVCLPAVTRGSSMVPTYADGQLLFCWRPKVWFGSLDRGDVVMVRFSGHRVMLLKRIVALGGETVAFSEGQLLVNGNPLDEPYVKTECDWELEPREVPSGHVYVIGDNRGTPMETHQFGSVAIERIVGVPLW
jgi:signal peptidase I